MDKKTSVIISDSNEEYRSMLTATIERSGEFTVVASAGDFE